MTTCKEIIDRAGVLLNDVENITWPRPELLWWLNDGQRELITFKRDAYVVTEPLALQPGARQRLPAGGVALVDLRESNGAVVLPADRRMLDAFMPGWMSAPASAVVRHVLQDDAGEDRFLVYPPQPSPASTVVCSYVAIPPAVGETDPVAVREVYVDRLLAYVLFRAYSKDTEFADASARAAAYFKLFRE